MIGSPLRVKGQNPSPQPPPRNGEGVKNNALSGSPSPLRGGGWGEGFCPRARSRKRRSKPAFIVSSHGPRSSATILGLMAVRLHFLVHQSDQLLQHIHVFGARDGMHLLDQFPFSL